MNEQIVEINVNSLEEKYEFNKIAKQASGAVMYRQGKAVLIAAVAIDEKAVDEDFLPLTVQYMEKSYAAAKIPGGFIKRETKPGDFETLTSRIIDRSLRPLFPSGFHYPVTITVMVVSADSDVDMQVAALHAANAALFVSDIPVTTAIAAVRMGTVGDDIVVNPSLSQQANSELDLLVVGSAKDVVMIRITSYNVCYTKLLRDVGGCAERMEALNHAYALLIKYIEEFRYTFDKEEISKQFPGADYVDRFKL